MKVEQCCCAGLDVHKRTVVACVLKGQPGREPVSQTKSFGTTTAEVMEMFEWFKEQEVTHGLDRGAAILRATCGKISPVSARPFPRGSPVEFFFPRRDGSPVFLRVSSAHMPSPLLRRTPAVLFSLFTFCFPGLGLFFPQDASLPPNQRDRHPHYPFRSFLGVHSCYGLRAP